jgi:hypothetical protein
MLERAKKKSQSDGVGKSNNQPPPPKKVTTQPQQRCVDLREMEKGKSKRQIMRDCNEQGLPCSKNLDTMVQRMNGDQFIKEISQLE